eukprot:9388124-Alexandrium_andersonii.AAC.1
MCARTYAAHAPAHSRAYAPSLRPRSLRSCLQQNACFRAFSTFHSVTRSECHHGLPFGRNAKGL